MSEDFVRSKPWLLILSATLNLLAAVTAFAQTEESWDGATFGLYWENDALAGSDRHYTQGAGVWYLTSDQIRPSWLTQLANRFPAAGFETEARKFSFACSQDIYTPEDLKTTEVVEDDRPYAGWLYSTLGMHRRGPGWFHRPAIDSWSLRLGVVGPPALAEETQKSWHGVDPQGWDNQLSFEPGLVLLHDRYSLFRAKAANSGWTADFIPSAGGALGNVDINLHMQVQVRLGYNIRNDFASGSPPLRYGFHLFGTVEGRYVIRNIFLDGNTFGSSHRVDKLPFVANCTVGFTVVLKKLELTVRQSLRTPEFEDQRFNDTFAAALIAMRF